MAGQPFNPFPTTGEDEYNQPSSRNIAPILNFQRGGLPDVSGGYKKRFSVYKENRYTLQIANVSQNIDMLAPDNNGVVGYIDLGTLIGVKSPFIFIPDIYSITLEGVLTTADQLSLNTWNVSLWDALLGKALFSNSPTNPASTFQRLGFEIPLPILQHDDFSDIKDYLNFLNQIYILPSGSLFNNDTMKLHDILVKQLLIYRLEQIPL